MERLVSALTLQRRCSHEAGFDHHMVMPVDPQALMKMLADLQQVKG